MLSCHDELPVTRQDTACARNEQMGTLTNDWEWCNFLDQRSRGSGPVPSESTFRQWLRKMRPPSLDSLLSPAGAEPALPEPSHCETAFRESLRKLRPPVLDRMLSADCCRTGPEPDRFSGRGWETFPRRKRSDRRPAEGQERAGRPRRLQLDREVDCSTNPSMLLQEAISESLRSIQAAPPSNDSSSSSPSPDADSVSYFSPILPDFFEGAGSSRIPSNIKELQTQLKAVQDECFTLKMSLHFMEEDNKSNSRGPEILTKENVKLKVENVRLKDDISKKNQLLQSVLEVLQKLENTDHTAREAELLEEKKELEQRLSEMEQLWSSRVAELERRLELTKSDCKPTLVAAGGGGQPPKKHQNRSSFESLSQQECQQLVLALTEELSTASTQMEEMSKSYNATIKSMEQELNSLHRAVTEKNLKIQQFLKERTIFLQETHGKMADLIALCATKDKEISRLKISCEKMLDGTAGCDISSARKASAEVVELLEEVEKKREEIERLQRELEEAREGKRRVVEEAEIMDLQQQELSERVEALGLELRALQQEKMELVAQQAAAELKYSASSDRSGNTSSTPTPKKLLTKRATSLGPAAESGKKELTRELEKVRKECVEKDRRLKDALRELQRLREKQKAWEAQELGEGKSKVVTTKSAVKPLGEPKKHVRRTSSCPHDGSKSRSSNRTNSSEDIASLSEEPERRKDCLGLVDNVSFLNHCAVMEQDLEKLSLNELRERVMRSEALCWSMKNHLEDMADFFSALLLNGDLQRFQSSLTTKEISKLKLLMDRTADITLSASRLYENSQPQLLSDSSISPIDDMLSGLDVSEPENQSRDRELSFISINSHVKDVKDFGSASETDIVPILGSSCDEQSGRSQRTRPSCSPGEKSHFNSLTPSLVHGLLEVLRRTERSVQKLCGGLEAFGQSHLFKLLVEEILDKLRTENLLQGSTPGQEWEEVSQELEAFSRRSQEVVQATAQVKQYLRDGLEQLKKVSESFVTSSPVTQRPASRATPLPEPLKPQPELMPPSTVSTQRDAVDEPWVKSLVDSHCLLVHFLEDYAKHVMDTLADGQSEGGDHVGIVELEEPLREMLGLFSVEEVESESATWYRMKIEALPKAVPLIQQVSQITFNVLLENLSDRESQLKETGDRLTNVEKSQEARLKEIRQVQDWNLRLQAEQKTKEGLLQSLKVREEELIQRLKVHEEESGRLSSQWEESSKKSLQEVKEQLEFALLELETTRELVKEKDEQIEQFANTLEESKESEKRSAEMVMSEMKMTLEKLLAAQVKIKEQEEEISRITALLEEMSRSSEDEKMCSQKLRSKVESVMNDLIHKDSEIGRLSAMLNEVGNLSENEKRSVQELRKELVLMRTELKQKEEEIVLLNEKMLHMNELSEGEKMSARRLRDEVESLQEQMRLKEEELVRLNEEVSQVSELSESEKMSAQMLKDQVDSLMDQMRLKDEEIAGLNRLMSQMNELSKDEKLSAQRLKNEVDSVRSQVRLKEKQIVDLNELISQMNELSRSEKVSSQRLRDEVDSVRDQMRLKDEEIARLDALVKELRELMDKENRSVQEMRSNVELVEEEVKNKDELIVQLSRMVKEATELSDSEKRSAEGFRTDMESMRNEMKLKESEIARLSGVVKEATELSQNEKRNAELLRNEMMSMRNEITCKESEIARLSSLVQELTAMCNNEKKSVQELKTDMESLQDEMKRKESEIAQLSAISQEATLVSNNEKLSNQRLRDELASTTFSLELAQQKEKSMSELMQKVVQAKSEVEASALSLRNEVHKQVSEQFELELKNAKHKLDTVVLRCKKGEKVCADLRKELLESKADRENAETKWTQKVEAERREKLHAEAELVEARKAVDVESKLRQELVQQVEQLRTELTRCQQEIQSNLKALEVTSGQMTYLRGELMDKTQEVRVAEENTESCRSRESKTRQELHTKMEELEKVRLELMQAGTRCKVMEEELVQMRALQGEQVTLVERKWSDKLACLERDAAKLQSDMEESRRENEKLLSMIANYEMRIRAISQTDMAPSSQISREHSSSRAEGQLPGDLLGEMRQLKQEVQLNNDSNARLYRELKHHIHPEHTSECPLSTAQKHAQGRRSLSSSPDSGTVEARRKEMVRHIKGDSSSGTGSAETLTLLTASSHNNSAFSNSSTSYEDLPRTVIAKPTHSSKSPARKSTIGSPSSVRRMAKSPKSPLQSRSSPRSLRSHLERSRASLSPMEASSSSSSSDRSSLHGRVLRQLGDDGRRRQLDMDSTATTRDGPSDDPDSTLIQYEGPLIVMLTTSQNSQVDDVGDGDAKDGILQRSNYSSPDLGIESDPNLGSSRSSSTSSTSAFHTAVSAWSHPQREGETVRPDASQQTQSATVSLSDISLRSVHQSASLNKTGSSEDNNSVGTVLNGMCRLRDLELLRQELEEALVTLQGMRAAVRARLDSSKIASPAKSLEYSTLREVDTRCQQLAEYLLRSKKLVDLFWTQPLAPPQEGGASSVPSQQLVVSSQSQGGENSALLREEVTFLQNKLTKLQDKYKATLTLLKAQKDRDEMVNRALAKQLSNTTKVIKLAKGNLKQREAIEQNKATVNKSA